MRNGPDREQLLFAANMEGAPRSLVAIALPIPGVALDGWETVLSTPHLQPARASQMITLKDSEGIVYSRRRSYCSAS